MKNNIFATKKLIEFISQDIFPGRCLQEGFREANRLFLQIYEVRKSK
jgi:hypothetical protein